MFFVVFGRFETTKHLETGTRLETILPPLSTYLLQAWLICEISETYIVGDCRETMGNFTQICV